MSIDVNDMKKYVNNYVFFSIHQFKGVLPELYFMRFLSNCE